MYMVIVRISIHKVFEDIKITFSCMYQLDLFNNGVHL